VARVLTLYSDFGLGPSTKPFFIFLPQETWDPILPKLEVNKKKKRNTQHFCIECEDWFQRFGLDKKKLIKWDFKKKIR
jgi:hypothetical protein